MASGRLEDRRPHRWSRGGGIFLLSRRYGHEISKLQLGFQIFQYTWVADAVGADRMTYPIANLFTAPLTEAPTKCTAPIDIVSFYSPHTGHWKDVLANPRGKLTGGWFGCNKSVSWFISVMGNRISYWPDSQHCLGSSGDHEPGLVHGPMAEGLLLRMKQRLRRGGGCWRSWPFWWVGICGVI